MSIKTYFDKDASSWEKNYSIKESFKDRDRIFQETIAEVLLNNTIIKVFEIGCGSHSLFRRSNYQYFATDISLLMLQNNKATFNLFQSDFEQLPIKGSFDLIIMSSVLEWLPNPQNAPEYLRNISRRGTIILISYPNVFSIFRLVEKIYAKIINYFGNNHYTNLQKKNDFNMIPLIFSTAGFKLIGKKYFGKRIILSGKYSSSLVLDIYMFS